MRKTIIRQSQMRVLRKRLDSTNRFDMPLILEVAERIELTLPDPRTPFQLECWAPMVPKKNRVVLEFQIVVEEVIFSETTHVILV